MCQHRGVRWPVGTGHSRRATHEVAQHLMLRVYAGEPDAAEIASQPAPRRGDLDQPRQHVLPWSRRVERGRSDRLGPVDQPPRDLNACRWRQP
jgi:hypothetical protein